MAGLNTHGLYLDNTTSVAASAGVNSGHWRVYSKTDGIYAVDAAGVEVKLNNYLDAKAYTDGVSADLGLVDADLQAQILAIGGNLTGSYVTLDTDQTIVGAKEFSQPVEFSNTSPFTVPAGSSLVTNLDADLLDGQHAADIVASANGYTDAATAAQKVYIDTQDADTLASANGYTDAASASLVIAINSGDAATLTSAQGYADTQDAATLASANAYTDGASASLMTYINTQDAATLQSAEDYADTGDATTLASANTYTDGEIATLTTYVNTQDAQTLADAKAYADTQDAATLSTANGYTDSQIATLTTYIDTQDAATLQSANDHADAGDISTLASANSYADGVAATAEQNAKDYADVGDSALNALIVSVSGDLSTLITDGDAATLASAYAYTETGVASAISTANSYTDMASGNIMSYVDGLDANVVHKTGDELVNGQKTFGDNAAFSGNVSIQGDLSVFGTTTTVSSQDLMVADNIIVVNDGEVGPGVTRGFAGIEVDRGAEANYQFLFDENRDAFVIGTTNGPVSASAGLIRELQVVATREDVPVDQGIAVWQTGTASTSGGWSFVTNANFKYDAVTGLTTNGIVYDPAVDTDWISIPNDLFDATDSLAARTVSLQNQIDGLSSGSMTGTYLTLDATVQTVVGQKTFNASTIFDNATVPFIVTGTDLVTNLNADMLDGQHASDIITTANAYSDSASANAVSVANAYTDGEITSLNTSLTTYIDTQDAATLVSANAYTDGVSADQKVYIDAQDAATLASANSYADTQDAATLASANSYTDAASASLVTYIDTQDAATLASANSYADTQDAAMLASANAYTDAASAALTTYINTQDAATLASANSYADTQDAANLVLANAYTDGEISTLTSYVDTQDAATLASANSYTDAASASLVTYIDAQDAATLVSAEAYTDVASGALNLVDIDLQAQIDALGTSLTGSYVTLDTVQSISGAKTFTEAVTVTVDSTAAPFIVSGAGLVANLNSDMVDGMHYNDITGAAADYTDALIASLSGNFDGLEVRVDTLELSANNHEVRIEALETSVDTLTDSLATIMQGTIACDTSNYKYTVTHPSIDTNGSFPMVSLTVPTSSSVLYVQGITNRTATSFDIVLSDVPDVSGYSLNWTLPLSGSAVVVRAYGVAVTTQNGGTYSANAGANDTFELNYSGSVTVTQPMSMADGQTINIIANGAAGSSLTWVGFKFSGGSVPTATANGTDIYTILKKGGNFFVTYSLGLA